MPTSIRPPLALRAALHAAALVAPAVLHAQPSPRAPQRDSARIQSVDTVRVTGRVDDLIGTARSASAGRVGAVDLRARPMTREGELLETVPGVIVTQHSGEGKANQYFVRGFNLDHGTDFRTQVEGMPVNMPTHGHGQGWTDLNFLMPELVDHLDYELGVYHASLGDFGSAGGAELHLVRTLPRPFAAVQSGANGLARIAGGGATRVRGGDLLAAGERKGYDGPWELAERVRKLNGLSRYSWTRGASSFSVLGMAYRNRWNSNDQIPARAVRQGLVGRLGQIDSTDGGESQRYSLSGSWRHVGARSVQDVQLYGIRSTLQLYSDFTYFLHDPERGDQFAQTDRRTIAGGSATHRQQVERWGVAHALTLGLQTRTDAIDGLALAHTQARRTLGIVRSDRVHESTAGAYVEAESRWTPRVRTVLGARADGFRFDVASDRAENSGRRSAGIVSPKASLVVTPSRGSELYVSGGFGFHSNDARGVTITVDPATGARAERVDPLVRSRGAELGLRLSPLPGWRSTVALWALDLDGELRFVGDAGATEASAASRRRGVTFANFYRATAALSLDADVSLAHAALRGVPADARRIPGALERVVAAGATWSPAHAGPFGALRLRRFGAYPLLEDGSVRAPSATLLNADAGWQLPAGTRLQLTVLNLLNGRADDIQYQYASRLRGEPADGVEGVHAHPIEPRQLRLSVDWRF